MSHNYDIEYRHVTPWDWQQADRAGSAVNLSGIVHSFDDVIGRIREDAREIGEGTDWVNRHPICVLYAEALHTLTGCGTQAMDAQAAVSHQLEALQREPV